MLFKSFPSSSFYSSCSFFILIFLLLFFESCFVSSKPLNLLFIMYDDLRPELSIYGKNILTPNFERLANKSMVFDYSFCQVSVCNPSRVSLLTGLRPDTSKTFGFQNSYKPNMILPSLLINEGFDTMNFGKLLHWEHNSSWCWSKGAWRGKWSQETTDDLMVMNSSYYPDSIRTEPEYLDYQLVTHVIDNLKFYHQNTETTKRFMIGLGFRMPHLPIRVPKGYFDLYDKESYQSKWNHSRSYPFTTDFDHGCCSYRSFSYISSHFQDKYRFTGNVGEVIPPDMHREMMWGYSAAVTYLDNQLGRILDVLDELNLWDSLVIVLTSDHGMHNGEKGLWKKWTLFDESTRIPLLISHPLSPYHGFHYPYPVEQIDIFPTILDLLSISPKRTCIPKGPLNVCPPSDGKSLYPVIMGKYPDDSLNYNGNGRKEIYYHHNQMIFPKSQYAIQQRLICGKKDSLQKQLKENIDLESRNWKSNWFDCKLSLKDDSQSIMGYSYRTSSFRYTMWIPFNFTSQLPLLNEPIIAEQLFDHQSEQLSDFSFLEEVDLINDKKWNNIRIKLQKELLSILNEQQQQQNKQQQVKDISPSPVSKLENIQSQGSKSHNKNKNQQFTPPSRQKSQQISKPVTSKSVRYSKVLHDHH